MTSKFRLLLLAAICLAGCETTSISESSAYSGATYYSGKNRLYRGELSEYDLLGIEGTNAVTDAEIIRALANAHEVRLKRGGTVLLVQSGAIQPDEPMRAELSKSFRVVPFDGRPEEPRTEARSVRLAAARAGCDHILSYWGVLESASQQYGTEMISWVPLVGWAVPEQTRRTRMRLKVAIIDTRTGAWTVFGTQPHESDATTGYLNRESGRAAQVEKLKGIAYGDAVAEILAQHTD